MRQNSISKKIIHYDQIIFTLVIQGWLNIVKIANIIDHINRKNYFEMHYHVNRCRKRFLTKQNTFIK